MIMEKLSGLTKKIVLAMLLGAIFGILAKSFLSSFPRIENLIILEPRIRGLTKQILPWLTKLKRNGVESH